MSFTSEGNNHSLLRTMTLWGKSDISAIHTFINSDYKKSDGTIIFRFTWNDLASCIVYAFKIDFGGIWTLLTGPLLANFILLDPFAIKPIHHELIHKANGLKLSPRYIVNPKYYLSRLVCTIFCLIWFFNDCRHQSCTWPSYWIHMPWQERAGCLQVLWFTLCSRSSSLNSPRHSHDDVACVKSFVFQFQC